jgi:hypothetical protein
MVDLFKLLHRLGAKGALSADEFFVYSKKDRTR